MKLSVSSACLFLGIIFLVSLWISHKNFKIFEQKSSSFFLFGRERRDTKKKETAKEQQGNDPDASRKKKGRRRETPTKVLNSSAF